MAGKGESCSHPLSYLPPWLGVGEDTPNASGVTAEASKMLHFYKRSMDEAAGLWALLTVVLLRGEVYEAQRYALTQFAKVISATDAAEFAAAVPQSDARARL
jgi:hypothetical protein